ncbi:MAG: hypothetical protein ACYCO3_09970 [Mycobacteriales bacterium]
MSRAFEHVVGQLKARGQTNAELADANARLVAASAGLLARVEATARPPGPLHLAT